MAMRRTLDEDAVLRFGGGVAGGLFLAAAGVAAEFARDHMEALGTICGAGQVPHCGWCYGAAGLALSGLAALAFALRPGEPRPAGPRAH